jgi:LysM repeat protein
MAAGTPFKTICYKVITMTIVSLLLVSCGAGRTTVTRKKSQSVTLQEEIIGYGRQFLGKPYRYAARGPRAFDCSGYTAFVFKEFGFRLNPSSAGQDKQFPVVTRKENLQKGDLVFFEGRTKNGKVGHVGIVTETLSDGEFRFIHASTGDGVIITSSAEYYWASRYLRGGRVLKNNEPAPAAQRMAGNTKDHRFTPAVTKEEPGKMVIPVITPPAKNKIRVAETTRKSVAEKEINVETTEEIIVLVQHDSSKNIPLKEKSSDEKNNDTFYTRNSAVILREDTLEIPKPVVVEKERSTPVNHTVKMGETLYSISRRYNCTVDQLRSWNPQLGEILKVGDLIRVSD